MAISSSLNYDGPRSAFANFAPIHKQCYSSLVDEKSLCGTQRVDGYIWAHYSRVDKGVIIALLLIPKKILLLVIIKVYSIANTVTANFLNLHFPPDHSLLMLSKKKFSLHPCVFQKFKSRYDDSLYRVPSKTSKHEKDILPKVR